MVTRSVFNLRLLLAVALINGVGQLMAAEYAHVLENGIEGIRLIGRIEPRFCQLYSVLMVRVLSLVSL